MNKAEFIDHISEEHGCTKADSERAINMFTSSVTSAMQKGQEVVLVGFGSFYLSKAEAREGRNPKTGEAIKIAARIQPKFSAGKKLKEACN